MARTRVRFGDISDVLTNLKTNLTSQAQTQAENYAWELYDQYSVQIWMAGITIAFWMLWVSTRNTCPNHSSKTTPV